MSCPCLKKKEYRTKYIFIHLIHYNNEKDYDDVDQWSSLPYEKYDQGVTATPTPIEGITVLYSDGSKSKPIVGVTPVKISSSDHSHAVPKSKLVDYLSIFRTEVNIMTIQLAL